MAKKKREKSTSPERAKSSPSSSSSSSSLPPPPSAAAPAAPEMPKLKSSMFVAPLVLFGWSKLDIEVDPETPEGQQNVELIRMAFIGCVAVCYLFAFYVKTLVRSKRDDTMVTVTTPKTMAAEAKTEEITVTEHDTREATKMMSGILMPLLIIGFLHYKWAYIRPLVMQCVMMPMSLYDNKLIKVHVLGQPATGDLQRPWKPPASPLAALMNPASAETQSAAKDIRKGKKNRNKARGKSD